MSTRTAVLTPHPASSLRDEGFTLVEALVAMLIVGMVVISYIGLRTSSLIDATYARNWRLAREIAEQKLSELQAGAREVPPVSGEEVPLDEFEGFSFKIVIGESAVADAESEIGSDAAGENAEENERVEWQRHREDYRRASSRGLSAADYEEQQRQEDINRKLAEATPSATEFEEVAVIVYFPKLEGDEPDQKDALMIKMRLSTLAISGMTPEQAEQVAAANGETSTGGSSSGAGSSTEGGGSTTLPGSR